MPQKKVMDPKRIVATGYDAVGDRYADQARRTRTEDRLRYESVLVDGLGAGPKVLDLGCGAGIPTTKRLAAHLDVTGVDISARQIARVRENVPGATFIHADMTGLDLAPASFDAVSAFFSIIHVPRDEHLPLLNSISVWLRAGGLFVASMFTKNKEADLAKNWLGALMYWSSYEADTNRRFVEDAGLEIFSDEIETYNDIDGVPGTFLWIVARKG